MVVVRESPRAKQSPDKNSAAWPPRSPFQALMSSPSGRKKWQDYSTNRDHTCERSTSPSPMRKTQTKSRALQALSVMSDENEGNNDDDDDDDEDEEMLQLKLAEIQAKLKLKRKQKARSAGEGDGKNNNGRMPSRVELGSPKSLKPPTSPCQSSRKLEVEVPLSPLKDRTAPQEHLSPARARLGLHATAKAQDVSLKRARDASRTNHSGSNWLADTAVKPTSFNERLAASKVIAQDQQAKKERIENSRSKGFASDRTIHTQTLTPIEAKSRSGARQEADLRQSAIAPKTSSLSSNGQREGSVPSGTSLRVERSDSQRSIQANGLFRSSKSLSDRSGNNGTDTPSDSPQLNTTEAQSPSNYDPYSEIHLSKRHIPHIDVARVMETRQIYTLPRLLKEVKAPHYDPPDCEDDFVVFAILASKSSPYDQKVAHRTSDEKKPQDDATAPRNKFMVFKLCDLKWEIDCFLFGTAFDQFWKLSPGTLLAILNPAIMPPKTNQHNGRFSLKLGSSEDCVMELGVARDLGYCMSVRKDGQQCGEWIDKRSTEICEFHVNLLVEKQRKHRMEVNTMWRGTGDVDSRIKSRSRGGEGGSDRQPKKGAGQFHREYGQLYAVPTGLAGRSVASLLDAEDTDALHDMTQEEASRKRIAAQQKDRDLAKRLGEIGHSVGAEYLRTKHGATSTIRSHDIPEADARSLFDKPKASDLGLLGNRASDIHLSPAKDRKRHFGIGAISSTTGTQAMGWGGATKSSLLRSREKSPEKGPTDLSNMGGPRVGLVRDRSREGSLSPKKRARFQLAKGIREPGRESLGEELKTMLVDEGDDDDDGLDIV